MEDFTQMFYQSCHGYSWIQDSWGNLYDLEGGPYNPYKFHGCLGIKLEDANDC